MLYDVSLGNIRGRIMLDAFGLVSTKAKAVRVGDSFGRLVVEAVGQIPKTYKYYAVCRCLCGTTKAVRFDSLINGAISSCGCLQKERSTTHGCHASGHYGRWRNMIDRCHNEESSSYPDYGGRGIKVCQRWHDIRNFVADLPDGYRKGLEIDRIDNDGNYEPGNVRWATRGQNCDNRRTGRPVTHDGKTQSVTRWAEGAGLPAGTISTRIDDLGWSVQDALTTPPLRVGQRKSYERFQVGDESLTMMEIAERTGIPYAAVVNRIKRLGWPIEKVMSEPNGKSAEGWRRRSKKFDFNGSQATIKEISEATGISVKLLTKRLCERGWPIEKAVIP